MASTADDRARTHRWWAPDVEGMGGRGATCRELWGASPPMTLALAA